MECTVNRVGEEWHEQLVRSGHHNRLSDLDLFAQLGISALRYPVLWERTMPDEGAEPHWHWPDERLGRLRDLGIAPIVGLLHHGSGPGYTNLLDPLFPLKLAAYARAVAERYPWVEAYTPINEPLTTSRFSGLYGIWHPHARDFGTFARIQLAQCKAVVLAMRAIREVNPSARLVQTEDAGKVHGTRILEYQAEYENARRWLTFDVLCGRMGPDHDLWDLFRSSGIAESELLWFWENPCPPDLIGFDHYLGSERFQDHRTSRYPLERPSRNGRHRYFDVPAVHVLAGGCAGPAALLRENWERYGLPIAITEAHLAGPREEQMRWLLQVWRDAETVRAEGIDVRAVTAWGLLGLFDWNSLCTRRLDWYESGAYDIRGPQPRPTAVAGLIRTLAAGEEPNHPVLEVPGWWHRDGRFTFGFSVTDGGRIQPAPAELLSINRLVSSRVQRLLIVGEGSLLAQTFVRCCEERGIPYHQVMAGDGALSTMSGLQRTLEVQQPWAVIDARDPIYRGNPQMGIGGTAVSCPPGERVNVRAAVLLARACARRYLSLVTFSSDEVFDGARMSSYVESDHPHVHAPNGEGAYQKEVRVLRAHPSTLVIRTGPLFGPNDGYGTLVTALQALSRGQEATISADVVSPTYAPDAADAALNLLLDGERGRWHLANRGPLSWAAWVRVAAQVAGIKGGTVCEAGEIRWRGLTSERGELLPTLDEALRRFASGGGLKAITEPVGESMALSPAAS